MAVIDEILKEAERDKENALKWGNLDHYLHFVVGVGATIAGGLAGYAGTVESKTTSGIAGAVAAVLTLLLTFMRAEDRSQFHYVRRADFGGVARRARILKDRGPTEAELNELNDRLTEIQGRRFGGAQGSGDS